MPDSAENLPLLVVLLPVYREDAIVGELVEYFAHLDYPADKLRCVVITTAKEESTATLDAVRQAVNQFPGMIHLHFPGHHTYRANQLNYAVTSIAHDADPSRTYVAVYNADSRPDADTYRAVAREALAHAGPDGELPPVLQQFCHAVVPDRHRRQRGALTAAAALQTFWHATRHRSQLRRYSGRGRMGRWWGMPASTTGHGEYFLLEALHSIGGFPSYAYADGLLIGWEMLFNDFPIRSVTVAFDHAEVPPSLGELVKQHAAWCTGLANVSAAARQNPQARWVGRLFVSAQWLTMAAWALRLPAYLLVLAIAARLGLAWAAATAAVVVTHAVLPVVAVLRHPLLRPVAAPERHETAAALLWSPITVAVDGIGFWSMLLRKALRRPSASAPGKTAR